MNGRGHVRAGHSGSGLQDQEQWQRARHSVGSMHMKAPTSGFVQQDSRLVYVLGTGL